MEHQYGIKLLIKQWIKCNETITCLRKISLRWKLERLVVSDGVEVRLSYRWGNCPVLGAKRSPPFSPFFLKCRGMKEGRDETEVYRFSSHP